MTVSLAELLQVLVWEEESLFTAFFFFFSETGIFDIGHLRNLTLTPSPPPPPHSSRSREGSDSDICSIVFKKEEGFGIVSALLDGLLFSIK